ncbi:hypothetical protein [Dactylosporangium sp. NPDC005555]|uniref:hypothetical protein n=1 Tax=Dactylosporangium sp. NPDC005555 TaxID=3154889 RepID=UPI0033AE0301
MNRKRARQHLLDGAADTIRFSQDTDPAVLDVTDHEAWAFPGYGTSPSTAPTIAWLPHSARAATCSFWYADAFGPDPIRPKRSTGT